MEINQLDIKSIRNYGMHGAVGLFMGIGVGFILAFIFIMLTSSLTAYLSVMQGIAVLVTILAIFGLYGFYVGYIYGGQGKASEISIRYAAAGIFGGLVTAGLFSGGFITMSGDSGPYLIPLFITLAFTGPILGFPKIKNMVLMTISSASGAALGYGIYVSGQNIAVYINNVSGLLFAFLISIPFSLFAIGIGGASISIGMYFTEGTAYTAREIPGFLRMTRNTGIALTLIVLVVSTIMFLSVAKYATTDVSMDISSGDGRISMFFPVLLENGTVMEMYRNPVILGNATTEIIDTDHGKAFKIRGSGSISIHMKKIGGLLATDPEADKKFTNDFTLSTSNATNYGNVGGLVDAWIYSEEDGTRFKLSIIRDNGWGKQISINTNQEVTLTQGWQEFSLSAGSMQYD